MARQSANLGSLAFAVGAGSDDKLDAGTFVKALETFALNLTEVDE